MDAHFNLFGWYIHHGWWRLTTQNRSFLVPIVWSPLKNLLVDAQFLFCFCWKSCNLKFNFFRAKKSRSIWNQTEPHTNVNIKISILMTTYKFCRLSNVLKWSLNKNRNIQTGLLLVCFYATFWIGQKFSDSRKHGTRMNPQKIHLGMTYKSDGYMIYPFIHESFISK